MKLIIDEDGSSALRDYTSDRPDDIELTHRDRGFRRAVGRTHPARMSTSATLLEHVQKIAIVESVLQAAARLEPPALRSLDAIHLASALLLGEELEAFVAYDERLLAAASGLGMPIAAPGSDLAG